MKQIWRIAGLVFLVCCGLVPAAPPNQPWFPQAPPLTDPAGEVILASSVQELFDAAATVKPGGTILVADGHYPLPPS